MDFASHHKSRLAVVEALGDLAKVASGAPGTDPSVIAEALDRAAVGLRSVRQAQDCTLGSTGEALDDPEATAVAVAYDLYGLLATALAHLVRWVHAARTAEPEAERFRRAAYLAAADAQRELADAAVNLLLPETVERFSFAISAITTIADVHGLTGVGDAVLSIPLPVPWPEDSHRKHSGLRVRKVSTIPVREESDVQPAPLPAPVAYLTFWMNGVLVADPQLIRPDVLYDLEVEMRFSRWPESWSKVELVPLHVEPAGTLDVPTFQFDAAEVPRPHAGGPLPDAPVTLRSRGRLRVHAALDLLARPLEVRYIGTASPSAAASDQAAARVRPGTVLDQVIVQGQRRLAFQSHDPTLSPITGFRIIDERLLVVRTAARTQGLPDDELAHFLTLLAAMGRIAAEALADDLYPGVIGEADFQRDVRTRLRATPSIAGALEEHPHAAGGITDLSFHKIRLELKAQDDAPATIDDAVIRYGQQTAQYIAASDRRSGILAVLDTTEKTAAPGDAANDIDLRLILPPSGNGRAILIGVVIVRGNLATPSALSRTTRVRPVSL